LTSFISAYSEDNSYLLDEYNRKIQPFAAIVPYMVAVGNHEDFFNYTNFLERYYMPYENRSVEEVALLIR